MKRAVFFLVALVLLWGIGLTAPSGSAAPVTGTLTNGWQRSRIGGAGSSVALEGVYSDQSGFLAIGAGNGWVSRTGRIWKPVLSSLSAYVLSHHVPDFNLVQAGLGGAVKGTIYSIKAEGPGGGYIAVGSYQPPGRPVTKTRAEVAISQNGQSWHTVSDKGPTFIGATMTDVAQAGPGWVAVGFSWGPISKPVVWTSPDAIHWQRIPQQPLVTSPEQIEHLIHGPAGLLAIATGLDGPADVWASSDGLHWQAAPGDPFRGAILGQVAAGGPGYLAAGIQDDDPALWTSSDGLHWHRVAGADSFPGDQTALFGVAAGSTRIVVVGRYGTATIGRFGVRFSPTVSSAWTWTPAGSALTPTPVPRTGVTDPKRFRLRLADLPDGYVERDFGGWPDFCDDGNTLCRSVYRAVGPYGAYETSFAGDGGSMPITDIESMAIEGTSPGAHALASLGPRLVRWWNRGGTLHRVPAPVRIGQETLVYRGSPPATSSPPGGHFVTYAVEWRDGRAIGQVYVEQQPIGRALLVEMLAARLARLQWQHLKNATLQGQISTP